MTAAFFLDTSAAVKRYVLERGSSWVTGLPSADAGNTCWLTQLTPVEALAALYRRARMTSLTHADALVAERAFRSDLSSLYKVLVLTQDVVDRAMGLVALYPLRAYDALQLAHALELCDLRLASGLSAPIFVSADQSLNQAAAAEGLSVEDPNQHP